MFNRVIIASGPTVEPIDPVRFISNRSSGKTGFHLAQEAKKREIGKVIFITGPSCYLPAGVQVIPVETAEQMREVVWRYFDSADVIIMAAAVCDYKIARYHPQKIKKGKDKLVLELTKNPDILQELGQKKSDRQFLVGFAAETDRILEHARQKFRRKNLDLLVLNRISPKNPAFGEVHNKVYLLTDEGFQDVKKMEKEAIAALIWDKIFDLAGKK
jgi:phosphopantothenoylcysteine decarboxylase/phosphopantothenate--cysteine ligase